MICSSDCFSIPEFSLKECYNCQNNCMDKIKILDSKTQVAFGKFDSVLNGCLHSCSKQKRKSMILSNEAVICYKDCLTLARDTLINLENHVTSAYSSIFD